MKALQRTHKASSRRIAWFYTTISLFFTAAIFAGCMSGTSPDDNAKPIDTIGQSEHGIRAVLTSPTNNSTLPGSTVTFTWNAVAGGQEYWLYIGTTGPGSYNIYSNTSALNTSATINNLPTDGSTIYVRFWTRANNSWYEPGGGHHSYTFTAASGTIGTLATLASPAAGSTLTSSRITIVWNTGHLAEEYKIDVGKTVGTSYYTSRILGLNTSSVVGGLPTDGSTIYLRIWTKLAGSYGTNYNDYTFTASILAAIISPANNSTLSSSTVTFTWAAVPGAEEYWLYIGTTAPGSYNIYNQTGGAGTNTSAVVTGLPTNGKPLYLRFWTRSNGTWYPNKSRDYVYKAKNSIAVMLTPADQSVLSSSTVTFTWSDSGSEEYWLEIGSSIGGTNYFNSSTGLSLSQVVTGLPTSGGAIYVRLWSKNNGTWYPAFYNDYTYTTDNRSALVAPAAGSKLGSSATFVWTSVAAAQEYKIDVGTSVGGTQTYSQTQGLNTSRLIANLPSTGTVHVRLWTKLAGSYGSNFRDYTFDSVGIATISTPAANASIGASVTFTWASISSAEEYWIDIGSVVGGTDIYSRTQNTATSLTVTSLPSQWIYLRLWTKFSGRWGLNYVDTKYVVSCSNCVTTLAGDGSPGSRNGNASQALVNQPFGVTTNGSGVLYIADTINHQIRKISANGMMSTVAGSSTSGVFKNPTDLAIDSSGNIYVADFSNHRIRKIAVSGAVTTLAGGTQGSSNGVGAAAQFKFPMALALDSSGNVYVADRNNHLIRKITPAGVVTTVAGSGVAGFKDETGTAAQFYVPSGIVVDSSGNLFVSDEGNHRIRKITPAGVVTTLAGSGVAGFKDGTGAVAQFDSPRGLTLSSVGILFLADKSNNRIRKITMAGVVTTIAGSGVAGFADGAGATARFKSPAGIGISDDGIEVYVADSQNHRIRQVRLP